MEVIGHEDEFVELEAAQLPVLIEHIEQQPGETSLFEQRISEMRD